MFNPKNATSQIANVSPSTIAVCRGVAASGLTPARVDFASAIVTMMSAIRPPRNASTYQPPATMSAIIMVIAASSTAGSPQTTPAT